MPFTSAQTESLEAAFVLDSKCGKVRAETLSLELGLKSQAVCQVSNSSRSSVGSLASGRR
jgi:hypothetical protein